MVPFRLKLLTVVGVLFGSLLFGCGGGANNSQSSGSNVNLAGDWQATTNSKLGYNTFLSGTISQTGSQVSGSMSISGSPCASSGTLSGTVSGSSVMLSLTEGGQSVSLSGSAAPDGSSIIGTYQAPAGGCTNGDSGTFVATKITSNSSCAPVPPGIVSWWRGEGNAQDATGANPGTVQGGMTFGPGEVGQAFYFDGSTGYVNVPDSSSLQSITTAVSVEMWAQPQAIAQNGVAYLYARRDPLTSEGFSVYLNANGSLGVLLRTTSSTTTVGSKFESAPGVVAFGTIQHIAATVNTMTGAVDAYVNGSNVPLSVVYGPAAFSGTFWPVQNLYLARREDAGLEGQMGAGYYPGMLDEISLYSTELSQSEIQSIVTAGIAGKCH